MLTTTRRENEFEIEEFVMSLGERLFAAMYDRFTASSEKACFSAHRESLLAGVRGDVLEIGAGTGANLSHYGDSVATLTLTEPSKPMIRRLERRRVELAPSAKLLQAPGEDLPFEDDSFDVAVCTLVLCGVDDAPRTLGELRVVGCEPWDGRRFTHGSRRDGKPTLPARNEPRL